MSKALPALNTGSSYSTFASPAQDDPSLRVMPCGFIENMGAVTRSTARASGDSTLKTYASSRTRVMATDEEATIAAHTTQAWRHLTQPPTVE